MDDKDKKEFIAFAAFAAAAAVFTLAALFLIVSPLITKSYSYAVYGASALLLLCTAAFYFARKKRIRAAARQTLAPLAQKLKKLPLIGEKLGNREQKTLLFSLFTAMFNAVYLAYCVWMAAAYLSAWYASMAGFYLFLLLARAAVLSTEKAYAKKSGTQSAPYAVKCKIFIGAGAAIVVGGMVMTAPIIMMAVGRFPPGAEIFNIVVNALFVLIKLVSAAAQLLRGGDFTSRALRNIGFITALMSLQMLEMTIVSYTTGGDIMWLMVAIIGGAVDGVTLIIGAAMTAEGALALKKAENE